MTRKFSVVDENTPRPKPMSLTAAIDHGTRLDQLVALQAIVGKAIENPKTPAPALAALSRQLLLLGREVDELETAMAGDDDITAAAGVGDQPWDETNI